MSVAPSPQTAGCDIMMGLWLQFEYSIWSFLSTRGFALQITTRSQKCLNYQPDSRLSHTYLHFTTLTSQLQVFFQALLLSGQDRISCSDDKIFFLIESFIAPAALQRMANE